MHLSLQEGVACKPGVDLGEILCVQEERHVGNDNCVTFNRLKLQIPASPLRAHFVKAKVKEKNRNAETVELIIGAPARGFGRFHMPHQILAKRKKTILVLPVWRRNGPDALLTTSGMLRLSREVQHFAHKRGFSGIRRAANVSLLRGGGMQRIQPAVLCMQSAVPKLAQFGMAAFSQGGDYITMLLSGNNGEERSLPPTLSVPPAVRPQFAEA